MTQGTIFEDSELDSLVSRFTLPAKRKTPLGEKKKKVIVIAGPTAVGKSHLALKIATVSGGEIVSADSMQVYRGMDIGTAKATPEERARVPHHLIDSRELHEEFNVVQFYHEAHQALDETFGRGHLPLVVGGTGFYIHALLYGPPTGPPSSPPIREGLEREMLHQGADVLYERLQQLDPDYAITITQRDKHKIIRALEIIALTRQRVSFFSKSAPREVEDYDFRCWFVYLPKEKLYERIEQRCEAMLSAGLIEEVKALKEQGLLHNRTASQAIGYRQTLEYLETAQTPEAWEAYVAHFKRASRRYAKRQFTWFRKEPLFRWLNLADHSEDYAMEVILQDYETSF